jgi:hypothetical protein
LLDIEFNILNEENKKIIFELFNLNEGTESSIGKQIFHLNKLESKEIKNKKIVFSDSEEYEIGELRIDILVKMNGKETKEEKEEQQKDKQELKTKEKKEREDVEETVEEGEEEEEEEEGEGEEEEGEGEGEGEGDVEEEGEREVRERKEEEDE